MRNKVNEIFLMRAFACVSVVFLHAIYAVQQVYNLSSISHDVFKIMQLLLLYATPMFVFISEFVLSYSYANQLPKEFFMKRFQYILVPYIFFGIFYTGVWAYEYTIDSPKLILYQMFLYIFRGDYHGYFVLIIFQFYLLHTFFAKYLQKRNAFMMIIATFVFNIIYLAFFNYTIWCDYAYIPFAQYIWTRGYFMAFPGWIFYFVLAYYAGRNIEFLRKFTKKYFSLFLCLSMIFGFVILLQYKYQLLTTISTKRPDIVPYTFSMIMVAFYLSSKIKIIPYTIDVFNRCSYGIYLLHPFYQSLLHKILIRINIITNPYIAFGIVFLASLYLSVFTIILVNKWSYGYLMVGRLGPGIYKNESKNARQTVKNY